MVSALSSREPSLAAEAYLLTAASRADCAVCCLKPVRVPYSMQPSPNLIIGLIKRCADKKNLSDVAKLTAVFHPFRQVCRCATPTERSRKASPRQRCWIFSAPCLRRTGPNWSWRPSRPTPRTSNTQIISRCSFFISGLQPPPASPVSPFLPFPASAVLTVQIFDILLTRDLTAARSILTAMLTRKPASQNVYTKVIIKMLLFYLSFSWQLI